MANKPQSLAKGLIDRIGLGGSYVCYRTAVEKEKRAERPFPDYKTALHTIYRILGDHKSEGSTVLNQISAIGHRVVHGGSKYVQPVLLDEEVLETIKENTGFAPLHNPANIAGIEISEQLLPGIPNVAVFDTALHQAMPPKAYLYGLPIEFYEKHNIRKYGFQGISHGYVAKEAAKLINTPIETLKIITCHLGNGSSITAFKNGKSIDTSMGLTPLEGLVMATRCGDVDAGVVLHLMDKIGLDLEQTKELLNKKSGLAGLCGQSDMRDIIKLAENGNKKAQTAIEVFVYRIQKYIGAYIAALNGVDAIVFTAGIGENCPMIRQRILTNFQYLGLKIDEARNEENQAVFSTTNSKVYAMTIPTNEELAIAHQTYSIVVAGKK
jgi:acetate kinase